MALLVPALDPLAGAAGDCGRSRVKLIVSVNIFSHI
jgi:hypothetical protein